VSAAALLAACLALPSTGLVRVPFLPVDPAAYGTLLAAVTAALLLAFAPARAGGALRVPTWLLALAPFWIYAALEGGAWLPPCLGGVAVAVLAAALTWTPRRVLVAGSLVVVLGGGAVLDEAGVQLLPAGWNPIAPGAEPAADAPGAPHPDLDREGPRLGAPVPPPTREAPALAEGDGPWWVRAVRERHPGPRPVVLVLDGAKRPAAQALSASEALTAVHGSEVALGGAYDLQAYDAVVVREAAWNEDDPEARRKAGAVAGYVRKGGLLIGPGPEQAWPAYLARALRRAAHGETPGPHGVLAFGLGRVARAALQADVRAVLDARLWVPAVATTLTARGGPPVWLEGLEHWRDHPASRRTQGVLLLVHVLVLAALARVLRGGGTQLLGVLLAAGAVAVGVAWTSPAAPGFRVHGVALDLGGAGGRRLEALLFDAGPRGYRGHVRWHGGGVVGVHGARLDAAGRLVVAPGHSAWVTRESDARGVLAEEAEDARAAVVRPLLVGSVDPRRLRYGRLPRLPVRIEGWGPVGAVTVVYSSAGED